MCGCGEAQDDGRSGGGGSSSPRFYAQDLTPATGNATGPVLPSGASGVIGSFTIGANTIIENGTALRLKVGLDALFSTARFFNLGIAIGLLGVLFPTGVGAVGSAVRRPFNVDVMIVRTGATTGRLFGTMMFAPSTTAPIAGFGAWAGTPQGGPVGSAVADIAIDWSISNVVELQYFQDVTAGGDGFSRRMLTVERIDPP